MITLLLPWVFGAAIVGALAVVGLHLLSVRRPPELLLPTTRFLPDRAVRAVSRSKPSDLLLMILRIGVLLAVGLAASHPQWRTRSRTRATLVVVDRNVVPDTNAIRAQLRADGDTVADGAVAFTFAPDSMVADDDPGALIALAWRSAKRLVIADAALDSLDLHVLLSRAPRADDEGWNAWRGAWPGRVVTHTAAPVTDVRRVHLVALDTIGMRAADDDPVRSAFAWHVARAATAADLMSSRVDTIGISRDDVVPAADGTGRDVGVRVYWPVTGVPMGWRTLNVVDTASALVAGGRAILGSFVVRSIPDSLAAPATSASAVAIAWWSDGRVAATETRTPAGCDRRVIVFG